MLSISIKIGKFHTYPVRCFYIYLKRIISKLHYSTTYARCCGAQRSSTIRCFCLWHSILWSPINRLLHNWNMFKLGIIWTMWENHIHNSPKGMNLTKVTQKSELNLRKNQIKVACFFAASILSAYSLVKSKTTLYEMSNVLLVPRFDTSLKWK